MSIIRAPRPESRFYTLDKSISEDTRLSWAARGLLIFLLGKPDHWEVSVKHLIAQTAGALGKSSGRDAVRVILQELEAAGYLKADIARSEGGKFGGMAYTVSEIPFQPETENPSAVEKSSPETENPAPAKPAPENPHLVSNEYKQETERAVKTPIAPLGGGEGEDKGLEGEEPPSVPAWPSLFDLFWAAYPRKVAKAAAEKAFSKRKPDRELLQVMLDAIGAQRKTDSWSRDGGRFIPHPATWLNQGRWLDELPAPSVKRSGGYAEQDYHDGLEGFACE